MTFIVNIDTPDNLPMVKILKDYVEPLREQGKVKVSDAYHMLMSLYDKGDVLFRHGYKFYFWFEDKDIAEQFRVTFGGLYVTV